MSLGIQGLQQTTNHKVVLPFYIYASFAFVLGALLLFLNTELVNTHHFNPYTLAITHIMALGWATMIILGASHQLIPVLVEGKLSSDTLAYLSFYFLAIGIPLLITAFYFFNTGIMMQLAAILINVGVCCYLINVVKSAKTQSATNVHAWFIIMAACWLMSTTLIGLFMVFNFSYFILPKDSLAYLSLHAHLGILGWFLLLVIGVGSRLIPMFLISKYTNDKMLWRIFFIINFSILAFIGIKVFALSESFFYMPLLGIGIAVSLFIRHCVLAYKVRIRKNVDEQMKTSMLSVFQILFPILVLMFCFLIFSTKQEAFKWPILYGFTIFFGWLTAIILGMTFKTLPFIVWNKVYKNKAHGGKTPVPKDLFSEKLYLFMQYSYVLGFVVFICGIIFSISIALKIGSALLLLSAIFYTLNTFKTLNHKAQTI